MSIIDDDPRPPYEQIADSLRGQIEGGDIGPGQRLPSTRDLMDKFGVANQTVQRAMRILQNAGLVKSVAGRGTFVAGDDDQAATPSSPSPEYRELRSQLETLAGEVSQIEQRMTSLEREARKSD